MLPRAVVMSTGSSLLFQHLLCLSSWTFFHARRPTHTRTFYPFWVRGTWCFVFCMICFVLFLLHILHRLGNGLLFFLFHLGHRFRFRSNDRLFKLLNHRFRFQFSFFWSLDNLFGRLGCLLGCHPWLAVSAANTSKQGIMGLHGVQRKPGKK